MFTFAMPIFTHSNNLGANVLLGLRLLYQRNLENYGSPIFARIIPGSYKCNFRIVIVLHK